MNCLIKSVETIKQAETNEFQNNFVMANYADIDFHLDGIHVCLEEMEGFTIRDPWKDSAILGIQAYHINDDNEVVYAHPTGNMDCG